MQTERQRTTARFNLVSFVSKVIYFSGAAFIAAFLFCSTSALGAPPVYQLAFLGNGSPSAINNAGTVVGARVSGNNYTPLISEGGAPWALLPVPAGAMSVFPTDINDSDVVVGVSFDTAWNPTAVRWTKIKPGVYSVQALPRLPGHTSSYATGINNLGQIVGARGSLGYVPTGTGWVYSETGGIVDLSTTYAFWVYPRAINDNGIIIGGQERLNLATGQVDVIGAGPSNYNPVGGVAINNNGFIAGTASLRSTSLNIVSLFRFEGAAGWRYLTGTSRYTVATSINSGGDIGYGELGPGVYLEGDGLFALGDLLDPVHTGQGWAVTGSGVHLNDLRMAATVGRNNTTNESGAVLLTPTGVLPPPTAPVALTGVPHTATRMEPFNSIDLTWSSSSALTRSYELQRRVNGTNDWINLSLIPPAMNPSHRDTTVGVAITYDYRVRAVGVAGPGPWSGQITVTSPATPLDTTPPVVVLVSPNDGANVSGIVPVSATATDNVAVEYLEISFWNQYTGQEVIIGSASGSGSLAANWDTRTLTPATYRVRAFAYDTMGNWRTDEANVNVAAPQGGAMRVTGISLSSKGRVYVTVTGRISVRDASGNAVPGALVSYQWTLPTGRTESGTAMTDSGGTAVAYAFSRRGTYTLTVTDVAKPGHAFDPSGSVLTRSITTR
jgi:uncharacterized membrane protein